ncbi:hypothetical protein TUM4249_10110 [Shewanella sp. KT0246]|nr:hypothetical protein TUM4249_10110 [Shewanella sp. KT0246]
MTKNKTSGKVVVNDRALQPMSSGVVMPKVKPPKATPNGDSSRSGDNKK